jgi:DNA-directed RNA polymerase specialized sigma24 family protein
MFELEGMSGDEIAAFTGTRLGTVWVRLHRARAAFQQELERRRRGGRG